MQVFFSFFLKKPLQLPAPFLLSKQFSDLVQFEQCLNRGKGVNIGIKYIILYLQQKRIIELNKA